MNPIKVVLFLFIFLASLKSSVAYGEDTTTYSITVNIENIQNQKGKVMIALYNSEQTYMKERYREAITEITESGTAHYVFKNVPEGEYAISTFHDENGNQELDKGLLGRPTENYGFSNNARGTFGPAKFQDAKFEVHEDIQLTIVIK